MNEPSDEAPRQRILRVPGARRAKLTAVEGTTAEPAAQPGDERSDPASRSAAASGPNASGPNDERMLREVPPHY